MNCQPNDMAFIVRVNAAALSDAIGMTLTVVEQITMPNGAAGWTMDRPRCVTVSHPCWNGAGDQYDAGSKLWFDTVPDAWLQPIRGERVGDEVHDIINEAARA